jgi:hypothetical protein
VRENPIANGRSDHALDLRALRAQVPASRLRRLTVHHKDGNHDRSPPDGSSWELLCVYCHENSTRSRMPARAAAGKSPSAATHKGWRASG